MSQDEPKIQIDSDWKAEAQAEKERLAAQAEAAEADRGDRRPGELPEADFKTLMGVLASQAIMGLGAIGDPKTGRVVIDLPGAKFSIDLLIVLEEKTKGNLSEDEATEFTQMLAELRARFVQISELVAKQNVADATAGAALAGGDPTPETGP